MAEKWEERFSRAEFKGVQNANASFDNVNFIINSSKVSLGRRLVTHEYPLRDVPYTEDLGRKVRIYTIGGSLLGGDYLTSRDNLAFVCERGGVGNLLHPYYGNIKVYCESLTFDDETTETRITRFQAIFIEDGTNLFPVAIIDTQGAVNAQVPVSLESLKSPFEKAYDIVSIPLTFTSGALETLEQAWDAIEAVKTLVNVGPTFLRDLQAYRAGVAAIVTSGLNVYESIVDLITFGLLSNEDENEDINPQTSFLTLQPLLEFEGSTDQPSQKTDAINALVQQVAVITMSLNSSNIAFTSANEAREFQNIILTKLDDIMLQGVSEESIEEYQNLRALVNEDISARAINLPELKTIQPKKTQPSIVLSQLLYGNKENAEDINQRNNIEHPGFIPGGQDLEVLLDA